MRNHVPLTAPKSWLAVVALAFAGCSTQFEVVDSAPPTTDTGDGNDSNDSNDTSDTSDTSDTNDTQDSQTASGTDTATSQSDSDTDTGADECAAEAPPSEHAATIERVWDEQRDFLLGLPNLVMDQAHGQGTLNYCVRYASSEPVKGELRDAIAGLLQRSVDEWNDQIAGYNCWPHAAVDVRVVGWAAADRATLDWPDEEMPVFVGDLDAEGEPKCPDACSGFLQRFEAEPDWSACAGGEASHFDMVLWLSDVDFGAYGHGGDWGQRIVREAVTGDADALHLPVLLHELGHSYGMPDFYHWVETPPVSVMWNASQVTDWDKWMLRRIWDELRLSRYPSASP